MQLDILALPLTYVFADQQYLNADMWYSEHMMLAMIRDHLLVHSILTTRALANTVSCALFDAWKVGPPSLLIMTFTS